MGRFSSPDPSGLYFTDPSNPQSFNLYSYVLNNPLIATDPTGMAYCRWDDGTHDDSANTGGNGAVNSQGDCKEQGGTWSYKDGLDDDGSSLPGGAPLVHVNVNGNSNKETHDEESTVTKILECTVQAGRTVSISNGLSQLCGGQYLKDGTWSRTVADALGGGNPFTGLLDAGKT